MTFSHRNPYSPPEVRKLNREQAALMLLGRAWDGDQNAEELLECAADVLFPLPQGKPVSSCSDFVTTNRGSKQQVSGHTRQEV